MSKKFFILALLFISQAESAHVLVTGGSGFVGSHLCDRLIKDGHTVVCADNLSTGSLQNIRHLIGHPRFTFYEHDVREPIDGEFDEIYNLASPAAPDHYQKDPVGTVKTCVLGALNVLELAQRCRAQVFQASTSEVYGDPLVHPQPESYWGNVNPIGLRACYDEGKRCAETLFFDYNRLYGVRIKVARIFNTYGPRMSVDGRVIPNFITQALHNKPLTIYGKGEQTRSFCYIDDLIEGIIRFMQTSDEITGPLNLGNPGEFTMLELAHKVKELTLSESPLHYLPLPADDPKQRRPDITQAKEILNWQPHVPLEEGLQKTIAYFKAFLRNIN